MSALEWYRGSEALLRRLFLPSAAGLVTAGAFTGPSWPVLAPVGLVVMTGLLSGLTPLRSVEAGLVFGLSFFGALLNWLWSAIHPFAWLALTVAEALVVAFAALGMSVVLRRRGGPIWASSIWMLVEIVRSTWPLGGLPWGRIGYSVLDAPWSALLPVLGVNGTGFVVVLASSWTGLAVANATTRRRAIAYGLVSATALSVVGWVAFAAAAPPTDAPLARIGVVQGGVPGDGTDLLAHSREVTANQVSETSQLFASASGRDGVDFVVWPENSAAVDPNRDSIARSALDRAVASAGVPVLAGVVSTGNDASVRNQGVVWTAAGPAGTYTKQHLVPFGEYVPWRALAERISTRVAAIEHDMTPGDPPTAPLQVGPSLVADALCFDVAYDDVLASQVHEGAELITVQTSNSMFFGTDQPEQQWSISRVRALETGRSVVVASVNGVSGAIAPDGQVITRLPIGDTASALVDVPLATNLTMATHVASPLSALIVGVGLVSLLLGLGATGFGRKAPQSQAWSAGGRRRSRSEQQQEPTGGERQHRGEQ